MPHSCAHPPTRPFRTIMLPPHGLTMVKWCRTSQESIIWGSRYIIISSSSIALCHSITGKCRDQYFTRFVTMHKPHGCYDSSAEALPRYSACLKGVFSAQLSSASTLLPIKHSANRLASYTRLDVHTQHHRPLYPCAYSHVNCSTIRVATALVSSSPCVMHQRLPETRTMPAKQRAASQSVQRCTRMLVQHVQLASPGLYLLIRPADRRYLRRLLPRTSGQER